MAALLIAVPVMVALIIKWVLDEATDPGDSVAEGAGISGGRRGRFRSRVDRVLSGETDFTVPADTERNAEESESVDPAQREEIERALKELLNSPQSEHHVPHPQHEPRTKEFHRF